MDEMIQKVVSSHFLFCPYTKDKIKELEIKPVLHSFDIGDDSVTITDEEFDKFVIWSHLAALLAPLIKPLLIFSSSIPSFFDLNWHDRLMCLKLRFFEIWVIHASRLVNCEYGTVTFSNGCYVSRDQLEVIYDKKFVAQFFSLCGCLSDLQLSDSTVALYSALVLYSYDLNGHRQPLILQKIQEKYKIYLSYQLHVHDKQPEVYSILLSLLPELQNLGQTHLQYVKEMSRDIFPQASEPVLLAEVFNVVREEDIKSFLKENQN